MRLVLINEKTGKRINIGDTVKTFRGETRTLESFYMKAPPSTGRVILSGGGEYYPGVIGAKIISED